MLTASATIEFFKGFAVVEVHFSNGQWSAFRIEGHNRYERGYSLADTTCAAHGAELQRYSRVS